MYNKNQLKKRKENNLLLHTINILHPAKAARSCQVPLWGFILLHLYSKGEDLILIILRIIKQALLLLLLYYLNSLQYSLQSALLDKQIITSISIMIYNILRILSWSSLASSIIQLIDIVGSSFQSLIQRGRAISS